MSPEDRFEDLIDEFLPTAGVTPPNPGGGFGSSALRVNNKIFAMLVRGSLVVKLPKSRVTELVASGAGTHFDANKGKPMKEWFSLSPESSLPWPPLAQEALTYVSGRK